jgi:hypothetical protein
VKTLEKMQNGQSIGPAGLLRRAPALVSSAAMALALATSGCGVVKGIFKAGVWAGVLAVLAVVGLLFASLSSLRRR